LSDLRTGKSSNEPLNQEISDAPPSQSIPRGLQRTRSMVASGVQESNKRQRVSTSESGPANDLQNISDQPNYLPNLYQNVGFDNTGQSSFQPNDLQWPDVFAHVSWEALFRGGDLQAEDMGPDISFP